MDYGRPGFMFRHRIVHFDTLDICIVPVGAMRFPKTVLCLLLVALSASAFVNADGEFGSCSAHPAYFEGLVPVLLKHWMYIRQSTNRVNFYRSFYLPRFETHTYYPTDDRSSAKYKGLDLFGTLLPNVYSGKAVTMYFNRPARVYMLVSTPYDRHSPAGVNLPGFTSEGWAQLDMNTTSNGFAHVQYGVFQKTTELLSNRVLVFSKEATSGFAELPDLRWIEQQGGISTTKYVVLIAERDGSPSSPPVSPSGVGPVQVGERCPSALHDKWKTPGTDQNDQDTYRRLFSTWHPMWDPCYWCGYDHDHGSNGGALLGVKPSYDYAAWKNYRQDEYHNGFKTIVFRKGGYLVAYDFHVEISQANRFFQRFHSGSLTIVHEGSMQVVVSMTVKLDFGALKVRLQNGNRVNVRSDENSIDKELEGLTQRSRLVNVMSSTQRSNLDPRYQYRSGRDFTLGAYEQWRSSFPCSTENSAGTFLKIDILDPVTALKSESSGPEDPMTILGVQQKDGSIEPHRSLKRKLDINDLTVAFDLCPTEVKNTAANGVWYTDTKGHDVFAEPGVNRMRQYIKPGFSLSLDGSYFVGDNRFTGLYEDGISGEFVDVQNTIDPYKN